jgi:hypothetical protein
MPDPTRPTIALSELLGIGIVSDQNREDILRAAPSPSSAAPSGLYLDTKTLGSRLEISTANRVYLLSHVEPGKAEISGHPVYCPTPLRVDLMGTRWLNEAIHDCYITPGMRLQFVDKRARTILTSEIRSFRIVDSPAPLEALQR